MPTHNGNAHLSECRGALLRSVTSDDDKTIDAVVLNLSERLGTTLRGGEFDAAGAAEHGTAQLDDAADGSHFQGRDVLLDQAGISLPDTKDAPPLIERTACHGTNGGVHARRIATGREDRHSLHHFSSLVAGSGGMAISR
jgi:hypothetical protein